MRITQFFPCVQDISKGCHHLHVWVELRACQRMLFLVPLHEFWMTICRRQERQPIPEFRPLFAYWNFIQREAERATSIRRMWGNIKDIVPCVAVVMCQLTNCGSYSKWHFIFISHQLLLSSSVLLIIIDFIKWQGRPCNKLPPKENERKNRKPPTFPTPDWK